VTLSVRVTPNAKGWTRGRANGDGRGPIFLCDSAFAQDVEGLATTITHEAWHLLGADEHAALAMAFPNAGVTACDESIPCV